MAARLRRNSNTRLHDVLMPLVVKVRAHSAISRRLFSFLGILLFAIYISITRNFGREDIIEITVSRWFTLKLKSRTLFRHVAVSTLIRSPLLLAHLTLLRLSVIICRYRTIKNGGAIQDHRAIFARDFFA